MAKELTGYIAVAGINLMGKEEYFAIYNDGYKYEKGDKVLVTGYRYDGLRRSREKKKRISKNTI